MPDFTVAWTIEVTADTPRNAARMARQMQDAQTTATVFEVTQMAGERALSTVTIDLAQPEDEAQPDERTVPDFFLDFSAEYQSNAYPEQRAVRMVMTVTEGGYKMHVENEVGTVLIIDEIDEDQADAILSMARIDHDLSGYEDDWTLPDGMTRRLSWLLLDDTEWHIALTDGQITEVADWLDYATGTITWDWAEQGEEWTS